MSIQIFQIFIPILFILISNVKSQEKNENDYIFQLFPSLDKNNPNYFYAQTNENLLILNSTENENISIINQLDADDYLYQNISSVSLIDDKYLVKTCFGPKILMGVEYNDKANFHEYNYLNKIKFCYSTKIINPYITNEHPDTYIIITYWTEISSTTNIERYLHKCILFYPNSNTFSNELILSSGSQFVVNIYYPEKCITFRDTDIFCGIHFSPEDNDIHLLGNNYIIETSKIFLDAVQKKDSSVYLVISNSLISLRNFHRPIGIGKSLQNSLVGKYDVYMTEIHDYKDGKEVTLLLYSYYKKISEKTLKSINIVIRASFIPYFLKLYSGLNIEDNYVNPNLFNYLVNNDELIIVYISQEAKMSLLVTRFSVNDPKAKEIHSGFKSVSRNIFIQTDICRNPKYLQSIYINSFINYGSKDKEYMNQYNNKDYYKYKKDVGVLISCLENDNIIYQTRKIEFPQCLNILDELNGMDLHKLEFRGKQKEFLFDLYKDPNLFSFRNVSIRFNYSEIFDFLFSMEVKLEGETNFINLAYNLEYKKVEQIKIIRKYNLTTKEPIKIQYRVLQNLINKQYMASQLISDLCFISINSFNGEECSINSCLICQNNTFCEKCMGSNGIFRDEIKNSNTLGKCICNTLIGFKKMPKEEINQCICEENYSYYKNINQCKSNEILEKGPYYINDTDEKSGIDIYDDCYENCKKCTKGGFSKEEQNCDECKDGYILIDNNCNPIEDIPSNEQTDKNTDITTEENNTQRECGDYCCLYDNKIWFKLGSHTFYYAKISKCVLIYYKKNELFFISNKETCSNLINDFTYSNISECLNNPQIIDNESYKNFIRNSKEYNNYKDKNITIYKNIEEENKFFYIYNPNIKYKNLSDIYSANNEINDLLIFKVDIKRKDTITRQVEYKFYNSNPEYIHKSINITEYIQSKSKRRLENNANEYIYLDLPVDWKEGQLEKLKELEKENINPFNTSSDFYNDVCNKYTTPDKNDIYLEDRKEEYYQDELYCENNCEFIMENFNSSTGKITCKCKPKINTDNSDKISFKHNDKDKKFKKTVLAPNIQSIKCLLLVGNIGRNIGLYISCSLFLLFLSLFIYKIVISKEENNNEQKLYSYLQFIIDKKEGDKKEGEKKVYGAGENDKKNEQTKKHKRNLKQKNLYSNKIIISDSSRKNSSELMNHGDGMNNQMIINNKIDDDFNNINSLPEKNGEKEKNNTNTINVISRKNLFYSKEKPFGDSENNNKDLISEKTKDNNDKNNLSINNKSLISSNINKYIKSVQKTNSNLNSIKDRDYDKDEDINSNNFFDDNVSNCFTKNLIKTSFKELNEKNQNEESKKSDTNIINISSENKRYNKKMNDEGIDLEQSFNINPNIYINTYDNDNKDQEKNINMKQSNNFLIENNNSTDVKKNKGKKYNIANPPKEGEGNVEINKEENSGLNGVEKITWLDTYINISVVLLCISFCIFLNILLIFNRSMVQLYTKDFRLTSFCLNNFIPCIGIICPLLFIRWYISIKNLLDKIYNIKDINKQNDLFEYQEIIRNDINKFKTKVKIYGIIGILFHIFNIFLFTSYCGIYPNSVIKLIINIVISIAFSILIILLFCLIRWILQAKNYNIINWIYQNLNIFYKEKY